MKRQFCLAIMLTSSQLIHIPSYADSSWLTKASPYIISATRHVGSLQGLKDMGAAYLLGMGLTTIHELGHAIVGKAFYGCPFNITLGTQPYSYSTPLLEIGSFRLGGLNPATAYASVPRRLDEKTPGKEIILSLAGPVFGVASSAVAYLPLRRYASSYHITRYVSI